MHRLYCNSAGVTAIAATLLAFIYLKAWTQRQNATAKLDAEMLEKQLLATPEAKRERRNREAAELILSIPQVKRGRFRALPHFNIAWLRRWPFAHRRYFYLNRGSAVRLATPSK